jgi:hypothetical protein
VELLLHNSRFLLGRCYEAKLHIIQHSLFDSMSWYFAKLKSRERSGWNEEKYISSVTEGYAERHKQPVAFLTAWKELRNKLKWISQLITTFGSSAKMPRLTSNLVISGWSFFHFPKTANSVRASMPGLKCSSQCWCILP